MYKLKQLLFTLTILFVSTRLSGQIKTPEVEVRAPTTSTLNEIQGETRVDGDVWIKSDGGAELNLWNTTSGQKWHLASGYNGGLEIGNINQALIDDLAPFFIDSNGQIGIGSTSPISRLTVFDENFDTLGVQGILIGGGTSGLGNYTPAIGFSNTINSMDAAIAGVQEQEYPRRMGLAFFVHNSNSVSAPKLEKMRLTRLGRLGIGTTNPAGILEVASAGSTELVVSGASQGFSNAGIVLKATQGDGTRATGVYMHDAGEQTEWYAGRPYKGSDKYVIFRNPSAPSHSHVSSGISNGGGDPTGVEAMMTIRNDGKVGIGTIAPVSKLMVLDDNLDLAGLQGILIGGGTNGQGNYTPAIGFSNTNNSMDAAIAGVQEATDPNRMGLAFFVHNSNDPTVAKQEVMRLTRQLRLGLGTTVPDVKLQVEGGVNMVDLTQTKGWFQIGAYNTTHLSFDPNEIQVSNNGVAANMLLQKLGGFVGIGRTNASYMLDVAGQVRADNVTTTSDARLKEQVKEIEHAKEVIDGLRAVSFKWRGDKNDNKLHYGVIAQELEKVLPELVSTDNEGYKSVDYLGMIGLLIKGFQERGEEIERLEREIAIMKQTSTEKDLAFEARLAKIERLLSNEATGKDADKSTQ